jgi:hypothetical protein
MGTKVRLWRWRRNALRRRSDATEAWVVLATGLTVAIGAPITGAATAWGVNDALAQQRQDRHSTAAVLTVNAPTTAGYLGGGKVRARVRWTTPDGTSRAAKVAVGAGLKAGARVAIWTDGRGALTGEPPTPVQAEAQAALAGASAAGGVCALLLAGRWAARRRLDGRRAGEWEREWAEVGPQWDRRRA